ncbi:MAG: flavodoxin-dependent (E)-4-hydroxy-3-methylbut-2-enyl-diphosphate synthase [Opitutaceae bacterium]|nr:flavodoxin-dependent (E)-4-hydroxy-3-methylbut-2-enyl-diphosphate synthase [Opitutaceae bacterium]
MPATKPLSASREIAAELRSTHAHLKARAKEIRAEGLLIHLDTPAALESLHHFAQNISSETKAVFLEIPPRITLQDLATLRWKGGGVSAEDFLSLFLVRRFTTGDSTGELKEWIDFTSTKKRSIGLVIDADAAAIDALAPVLKSAPPSSVIYTLSTRAPAHHPLGACRALAEALYRHGLISPLWIRNTAANAILPAAGNDFPSCLLEASILTGALLCDGLGDLISVESAPSPGKALTLAYNILQGAGARVSKTEFVACPSCGRTLFDLQTTTRRIRAQTGHLKGVKLAIMGCIVNGPGEMADADFGYVGGAPGKINLYVGKQCVAYNIPQSEADTRLIALIKSRQQWTDPD